MSLFEKTTSQLKNNPKMLTIDFSFRELEIFKKVAKHM